MHRPVLSARSEGSLPAHTHGFYPRVPDQTQMRSQLHQWPTDLTAPKRLQVTALAQFHHLGWAAAHGEHRWTQI